MVDRVAYYRTLEGETELIKILFICHGNIVRRGKMPVNELKIGDLL